MSAITNAVLGIDSSAYTGNHIFNNKGYYYIHKDRNHIGRADNKERLGDKALAAHFREFKNSFAEQSRQLFLYRLTENQHLIVEPLNTNAFNLLNATFDIQNNQHLDILFDTWRKEFAQQLPTDTMQALYNVRQNTTIDVNALTNDLNSTNTGLQAFNDFITLLSQAAEIADPRNAKNIKEILTAAAITAQDNLNGKTFRERYGTALEARIRDAFNNSQFHLNRSDFTKSRAILEDLNRLASWLEKGQTSSKKTITGKTLMDFLNKEILSKSFAEGIASVLRNTAANSALKIVGKKAGILMGKDTVPTEVDIDGVPYSNVNLQKSVRKTDIRYGKTSLIFEYNNQQYKMTIDSTGISNKLYMSNIFPTLNDSSGWNLEVSSGRLGFNVRTALAIMFNNSTYTQYLASNAIVRDEKFYAMLQLQDLIITRFVVNFFMSRGPGDMATFLYANGVLVSMWDILQQAITQSNLHSRSYLGADKSALALSITGRNPDVLRAIEDPNKTASERVARAGEILGGLMSVTLYVNRIKNYLNAI